MAVLSLQSVSSSPRIGWKYSRPGVNGGGCPLAPAGRWPPSSPWRWRLCPRPVAPAPAAPPPPPPPPPPPAGYENPVSPVADDPFVLDDGATHDDYWEFGTGDRFPMLRSSDLVHWTSAGTAFTARPSWV